MARAKRHRATRRPGEDSWPDLDAWADAQPRLFASIVDGAIVERWEPAYATVWDLPRNNVHAVEAFLRDRGDEPLSFEEGEVLLGLQDDPTAVLALLEACGATRRRRRRGPRRLRHPRGPQGPRADGDRRRPAAT